MISFTHKGDWSKTEKWLNKATNRSYLNILAEYGKRGVEALSAATPVDSGLTASSWNYRIEQNAESFSVVWTNSNIQNGVNIALILNYGHGTGTGGYVRGRKYIAPAIQPLFDEMADKVWKEVTAS